MVRYLASCGWKSYPFQHSDDLGPLGRAQSFDRLQIIGRGVQEARNTAKATASIAAGAITFELQQLIGHLQHTFACNAGAQKYGQQLSIAERTGAAGEQLFARAGVDGKVFQGHGIQ